MNIFKTPTEVNTHCERQKEGITEQNVSIINVGLKRYYQPLQPLVSIVIIAHNEEKNLAGCLSSLSAMETSVSCEIIVVNNASNDQTGDLLRKLNVTYVFEERKGVGFAREAGLSHARGKYVFNGDADTIYPKHWVDSMLKLLTKPGVVGVFGSVSFIAAGKSRINYALYELFRNAAIRIRTVNRPELSVGGANFAMLRELAKSIGWRTDIKRGEDGYMAWKLKKYGRIVFNRSAQARIWTDNRTLAKDKSFARIVLKRFRKEFLRIHEYFSINTKGYPTRTENKI